MKIAYIVLHLATYLGTLLNIKPALTGINGSGPGIFESRIYKHEVSTFLFHIRVYMQLKSLFSFLVQSDVVCCGC